MFLDSYLHYFVCVLDSIGKKSHIPWLGREEHRVYSLIASQTSGAHYLVHFFLHSVMFRSGWLVVVRVGRRRGGEVAGLG